MLAYAPYHSVLQDALSLNGSESSVGSVPSVGTQSCNFHWSHPPYMQSSLLGHLHHLGLLRSDTAFVEFGAGRGRLSHWIQAACGEDPSIKYILVDRSNCRRKVGSPT